MGTSKLCLAATFCGAALLCSHTSSGQTRSQTLDAERPANAVPAVRTSRLLVRVKPVEEYNTSSINLEEVHARIASAQQRIQPLILRRTLGPAIDVVDCGTVAQADALALSLKATGDYSLVEPDWLCSPCSDPNDPFFPQQWHLTRVNAPTAWNLTQGTRAITLAMVDTGIDRNHPELRNSLVSGYNSVTRISEALGGQTADINGHGTETAGVAAASGNNGAGIAGILWNVRLMPVRATNSTGGAAFMSDIIDGIGWSIGTGGARVVVTGYAGIRAQSCEMVGAWARLMGALLVWPAENSGDSYDDFDWPSVIITGATGRNDLRTATSCHGRAIDLAAPGESIYTCTMGGGYGWMAGNSYTGPQAAATLALMLSVAPELSPAQAEVALKLGCSPLPGPDANRLGAGLLNVAESVRLGSRVDFNRDGFIDFFDYDGFVVAFERGSRTADINNDGFVDFFDYEWFIRLFEATW